jgi:ATP-dependent helicase/DNAse subunit B
LGENREALATKQAFSKAKEVLEMLAQFLGEEKVKLDEFYTLIISGMESVDISLLPLSIDSVQIVTSSDGLYGIKNLYIMGASEGSFPKREQDLGLIQDGEINSLEGISEKKIEPTIKTINRRERFRIYELLQLATNKLTISFSERTSKGEETKMSSLMQTIASLFYDDENEELKIEKVFNAYGDNEQDLKELVLNLGTKKNVLKYFLEKISEYKQGTDYSCGQEVINSLYNYLKDDFDEELLKQIQFVCLIMSESYINTHENDLLKYGDVIENRLEKSINKERFIHENKYWLDMCKTHQLPYVFVDEKYDISQILNCL